MRLPSFGVAILVVSIFGFFINLASLIFLIWRHKASQAGLANLSGRIRGQSTLFHNLLAVLAACDLLVVICCGMAYGLPDVWEEYLTYYYPYIVPYLLPITHIAVMTSVYSTILISFERYVRICYICQLRPNNLITKANLKYYILGIILGPILFYLPKFFEVRPIVRTTNFYAQVNCSRLSGLGIVNHAFAQSILDGLTLDERTYLTDIFESCLIFHGNQRPFLRNTVQNITRQEHKIQVQATALRSNPVYYRVYYVHMNTIFASLIPLASLLFFNVCTLIALRKMIKETATNLEAQVDNLPRDVVIQGMNEPQIQKHFVNNPINGTTTQSLLELKVNADQLSELKHSYSLQNIQVWNQLKNEGDPITVAQVTIESPFEDQDEVLKADSSTFPFENIPLLIEPTLVKSQQVLNSEVINIYVSEAGKSLQNSPRKKEPPVLSFTEPLEHFYSVALPKEVMRSRGRRRSTLVTMLESNFISRRPSQNPIEIRQRSNSLRPPDEEIGNSEVKMARRSSSLSSCATKMVDRKAEEDLIVPCPYSESSESTEPLNNSPETTETPPSGEDLNYATSSLISDNRILNFQRQHSERVLEQKLARISCFIVWFFLFCHVWKLIPTAFEAGSSQDGLFHQDWPTWVLVVENLSHLLITINSTVNFLIYVIM